MRGSNGFPHDFILGAATASYQIEGSVHADGRGESIWDRFSNTPGKVQNGDSGAVADDHYRLWREDVALMKSLGFTGYRFSIAWPRIIPTGRGASNEAGLDFYDKLVDGLLEAGITPFATLYHWDLPQVLQDQGGWANRATVDAYVEYADVTARRLGDRVKNWITHNEPWVVAFLGYLWGVHAPGIQDQDAALRAVHHLLLSHGRAVPVIRAASPGSEVGITLNLTVSQPASDAPADVAAARWNEGFGNRIFLDPLYKGSYPDLGLRQLLDDKDLVQSGDMETISAPIDFLGVNYYTRSVVRAATADDANDWPVQVHQDQAEHTEMDWEVYPDGLRQLLESLAHDYPVKKLYVTENGAAFIDTPTGDGHVHDERRVAYLQGHFDAAAKAIANGAPLKGYFVWSLLDNFEWAYGYSKRFGIVYVDYTTQQRIAKDSALWYKQFIADHKKAAAASPEWS